MTTLWARVDSLLDRLDPDMARAHGLGPLAARRRRERGLDVPEPLAREERSAAAANLIAPTILERARAAYDGSLVLIKGPEIAGRYPGRARRFGDLDLLADDADAAQAALLAAGFQLEDREWPPVGWDDELNPHYHLHPLQWPGLPMNVEVHREVKWLRGFRVPASDEIIEAAVSASVGVDGLLAPAAHHHALLLAAHAWAEVPLRTIRELIDVKAFADGADRAELERAACRWGIVRAWRTTIGVAGWLLGDAKQPLSARIWARHFGRLREPTVVEMHLERWLSPFWMLPAPAALARSAARFADDFRPSAEETWGQKRRQMLRAVLHPLSEHSEHATRWRGRPARVRRDRAQDE